MIIKTVLALVATTGLLAAAVTLAPIAPAPTAGPTGFIGQSHHNPRHMTGKLLSGCLDEPVECGLVVW